MAGRQSDSLDISEQTRLIPARASRPREYDATPQTRADRSRSRSTIRKHHNLAGLAPWRFRVICAAIWSCTFLCALDGTVVATLLVPIGSAFHASNQASWVGTAYLLSLCCFTPIYGRLSDLIGRRGAYLTAMFFFSVGTLLCAIAPSMYTLIAARCFAGIGGGGLASVGVIIMTDLVDLRHRGLFQGYANIMFGLGGALGGPMGGTVSDRIGWRWAFGIQVPLLVLDALAIYLFVNVPPKKVDLDDDGNPPPKVSAAAKLRRIDYPGSITLVGTIAPLLLSLSIKTTSKTPEGLDYTWSNPLVWGLLVTSGVFLLLFLLVEGKVAPEPILPLSLLARRTPAAVAFSLFTVTINQFSIMYNIPLFFSAVRLDSASVAGAHLLPYTLFIGVGSILTGWIMRRTGRYWWACVSSAAVIVLSSIMLLLWNKDVPAWLTWAGPIPAGFGYAGILTSTLVALMTNVTLAGKGEVAVATSMSYLFRTTGQVLGVAISAAIVQSVVQSDLTRLITSPDAPEIIASIRHSTSIIPSLPAELRAVAVSAYDHALHVVFIMNLGLSLLSVLGLMCVEEEEMPDEQAAMISGFVGE